MSQNPTQGDNSDQIRAKSHRSTRFPAVPCLTIANSLTLDQVELIITAFIPPEENRCDFEGLNNVPRICGAWVGVLPQLVRASDGGGRALPLAVAAFSSCLISEPDAGRIQIYNAAVEAVRVDLNPERRALDAALIAAVMCLTLTEVSSLVNYRSKPY